MCTAKNWQVFLDKEPGLKAGHASFSTRKLVRVYGRQGKIVRRTHEKINLSRNLSRKNCSSVRSFTSGQNWWETLYKPKMYKIIYKFMSCIHGIYWIIFYVQYYSLNYITRNNGMTMCQCAYMCKWTKPIQIHSVRNSVGFGIIVRSDRRT